MYIYRAHNAGDRRHLETVCEMQNLEVLSFKWTIQKFKCIEFNQNSVVIEKASSYILSGVK